MLVDRKGRRVSELSGPGVDSSAPKHRLPDEGDWRWAGWHWCHRSLNWHPQWHNKVLHAWAIEFGHHWGVTGRARAYGTGNTFAEAWAEMCRREFAYFDDRKVFKPVDVKPYRLS